VRLILISLFFVISPFVFKAQNIGSINFASEETLEVVSWNLEWFPKNGQTTLQYVASIIQELDADVIACQEIGDINSFNSLLNLLDNYSGFYASSSDGLAYIYNNNRVDINDFYEIYTSSSYSSPFPRRPFVMDFNFQNKHFIVINNHLKCCGDGYLNLSDGGDEETRRLEAVNLLKSYIDTQFQHQNVFVVGDWNDEITDPYQHNVFRNVLDDKDNYLFSDLGIAYGNPDNWSYPSWPSHLDHILITNELFASLDNDASVVEAIRIDELLGGGWDEYEENVSDHRPVAIKLLIPINLGNEPPQLMHTKLNVHPNPFSFYTTITLPASDQPVEIEITDIFGRTMFRGKTEANQLTFTWHPYVNPSGIYFIRLFINGQERWSNKLIYKK